MMSSESGKKAHFSDVFWCKQNDDFNSTFGFDAVTKRMKDGFETCKSFSNYLRQRCRIEDEYVKGLQRLIKSSDFGLEIGKLHESLESVRLSNEKVASEYQSASKQLSENAENLQIFADKQKSEWKQERAKVEKVTREKKQMFDRAMSTKKTYQEKSKDAEIAELNLVKAKVNVGQNPKEVEKNMKIRDKSKQEADKAEQNYHESVRTLDETRDQWEKELLRYYEFCEERDKQRILKLQDEMWKLCNITSLTYVGADQCCEDVRKMAEQVVPEIDLSEFMDKNETGSIKPASITFEPYLYQNLDQSGVVTGGTLKPQPPMMAPPPVTPSTGGSFIRHPIIQPPPSMAPPAPPPGGIPLIRCGNENLNTLTAKLNSPSQSNSITYLGGGGNKPINFRKS